MKSQAQTVRVLVDFGRLAVDVIEPRDVLPLLARIGVTGVGADGALVLAVTDEGTTRVAASHDVPVALAELDLADEALDSGRTGELLLRAAGRAFESAQSVPIVSGGRLYGALALLTRSGKRLDEDALVLAHGLCDLAALALDRRFHGEALRQSHQDLAQAEETLARTERLRTLGQMSAGIAHDLRNLFNPLHMHVQLARKRGLADDPRFAELVGRIETVVKRGIDTVERLRAFSRQAPEKVADFIDVNHLVREAAELAKARTGRHRVVLELGEGALVRGSSSEFVSAILNLIVNAADAMPAGGTITLRTVSNDDFACIEVADDGPGIPPEVEAHIFEPFFTTKGEEGTGLGLATIYAFVQRTGGRINVQTAVGRGTTFRLEFPRHQRAATIAG